MLSQIFKHSFKSLTTKVGFGIKKQPSLSKTENIDGSIQKIVHSYMDKAAKNTNINESTLNFYKSCDSLIEVTIPFQRTGGKLECIKGYRCQHKAHKLPTKGGFIINKDISKEDIEGFACLNTIRAVVLNMPHGGAKGAICLNPKDYSERELEMIIRKYTIECAKKGMIGSSIDIPGTDLGSTEREMNWMKDTYTYFYGAEDINAQACVTGKSLNQGGLEGRIESSGFCVSFSLEYMLNQQDFCDKTGLSKGLKGKTFIIEGYGNVGYWAAKFLQQEGAILIGVIEHDGEVFNRDGIDADDIQQYLEKNKGVTGYTKAELLPHTAFQQCDVFIPAYFAKSINSQNANKFQCKIVVEAANLCVTPEAEQILESKGIQIIPDVISSSGGFLGGYFEWIKNISHKHHGSMTRKWEQKSNVFLLETIEQETGLKLKKELDNHFDMLQGATEKDLVFSGLEEGFENSLNECIQISKKLNINLREAAYVNALQKVDRHYKQVGLTFGK